jgi:hypothetical protein
LLGIELNYRVLVWQSALPATEGIATTTCTRNLDLAKGTEPPAGGIRSRTIFQDDRLKAVILGPGQGDERSEHTAAKPAMPFLVQGEATEGPGDDLQQARGGTWGHRPASLKHSIKATTPVVMRLVPLK